MIRIAYYLLTSLIIEYWYLILSFIKLSILYSIQIFLDCCFPRELKETKVEETEEPKVEEPNEFIKSLAVNSKGNITVNGFETTDNSIELTYIGASNYWIHLWCKTSDYIVGSSIIDFNTMISCGDRLLLEPKFVDNGHIKYYRLHATKVNPKVEEPNEFIKSLAVNSKGNITVNGVEITDNSIELTYIGATGFGVYFKSRTATYRLNQSSIRLGTVSSGDRLRIEPLFIHSINGRFYELQATKLGNESVPTPTCPNCKSEMKLNYRNSDLKPFYGCTQFPKCRGARDV